MFNYKVLKVNGVEFEKRYGIALDSINQMFMNIVDRLDFDVSREELLSNVDGKISLLIEDLGDEYGVEDMFADAMVYASSMSYEKIYNKLTY